MGLFDGSLEDALSHKAESQGMDIQSQFAKKRRQAVAQQAHSGRLGSGVANYTLGDIDAGEAEALGGVEGSLAEALGGIPTQDILGERDFRRNIELARKIAAMNEPSGLEEAFGAIGGIGNLAATGAAFF